MTRGWVWFWLIVVVLALSAILSGCDDPPGMPGSMRTKLIRDCLDAGGIPELTKNWSGRVTAIYCRPDV